MRQIWIGKLIGRKREIRLLTLPESLQCKRLAAVLKEKVCHKMAFACFEWRGKGFEV